MAQVARSHLATRGDFDHVVVVVHDIDQLIAGIAHGRSPLEPG
jgi:hypothetical protein